MFRSNRLWPAILTGALVACGPRYDCSQLATPGSLAVTTRHLEVPDTSRSFAVKVRLFAPEKIDGDTKLVIISPGLGAELDDLSPLAQTLAQSNYAAAVVEHRVSTTPHVCGEKLHGVDCWHALEDTETHAENWDDRFSDILLLMDELPRRLSVDGKHIALVGHSFGAFNSMALGGTTYVDPRTQKRIDRRDPRVVSVVAMSPQGPRWFGLDDQSWDTIDRPLFLMTGDHDGTDMVDDSPEWRREPFPHMHGGDKLMLRIDTGEHMSFTAREKHREVATLVQRSALAFIDSTMRRHESAPALTGEVIKDCSRGHASLERH